MNWRTNSMVLMARRLAPATGITKPLAWLLNGAGYEARYEAAATAALFLANPALRAFGIEVHFGILQDRGDGDVPSKLESLLRRKGFIVRWPDVSHIPALRG